MIPIRRTTRLMILRTAAACVLLILLTGACPRAEAQTPATRVVSGVVITDRDESVAGAAIIADYISGVQKTVSDAAGKFNLVVPDGPLTLTVEGKNLQGLQKSFAPGEPSANLQLKVLYVVP